MHLEKRLPRNGKEGFLYGSIIWIIVMVIEPAIIGRTAEALTAYCPFCHGETS